MHAWGTGSGRAALQSASERGAAQQIDRGTRGIATTNLDYSEWANFLGNKALVGALLSRLRHQCHTVKID